MMVAELVVFLFVSLFQVLGALLLLSPLLLTFMYFTQGSLFDVPINFYQNVLPGLVGLVLIFSGVVSLPL